MPIRAPAESSPRGCRGSSPSSARIARGRRCRAVASRSEEHTSELQSRLHLVCRLLLEKKKYERDLLWTYTRNSLIVTAITVSVALVISFLSGIAISRLLFRCDAGILFTVQFNTIVHEA